MARTQLRGLGYGSYGSPYGQQDDADEDALLALLDQQQSPAMPITPAAPVQQRQPIQLPEVNVVAGRNYDPDVMGDFEPMPVPQDDFTSALLDDKPQLRAPTMPGGSIGTAAPRSPALGQPNADPELDAKWRQTQMQALDEANKDQSGYGFGEFARDNGAALIASLLDVGFNKGRGLPAIVGVTANEVGKQEASRRATRQQARDFALRARPKPVDPVEQWYKQASIADRSKGRELQAGREQGITDRFGQKLSPDSDLNTTNVEIAGRKAATTTERRLEKEHELNPIEAGDKGAIAAAQSEATTNAATDALRKNPRAITEQQEVENARSETVRSEQSNEKRRQAADQYAKETKFDTGVAQQLDRIDAIVSKYGKSEDVPGVGFGNKYVPGVYRQARASMGDDKEKRYQQDATELNNARDLLNELSLRKYTGAAAPIAERVQNAIQVGADRNATPQQFKTAIKAARELTRSSLAGYSAGKEDAAADVLSTQGLGHWLQQATPQEARAGAPGELGARQPAPTDPLSAIRQPQPQPRAAATPPPGFDAAGNESGAARKVRLRLPSGAEVTASLTDEQLQRALSKGAQEL